MEDPSVIAKRLTETAKDVVDQARVIAKEAVYQASDVKNFTAAQLIASYMKAVDLAMTGGLQAAKDVLGVQAPDTTEPYDEAAEGRRLVADAMEAISRRILRQTSVVAQDAADMFDKNPGSPTVWAQSMVRLADIAMLGCIELAETALIGPAPFEMDPATSSTYPAGGTGRRKLKITKPGLVRPGTVDPIPAAQLQFRVPVGVNQSTEAPDGILEDGENQFFIAVQPAGMISGIFVGSVEIWTLDDTGDEVTVVDTMNVEVAL